MALDESQKQQLAAVVWLEHGTSIVGIGSIGESPTSINGVTQMLLSHGVATDRSNFRRLYTDGDGVNGVEVTVDGEESVERLRALLTKAGIHLYFQDREGIAEFARRTRGRSP